MKNFLRLALLSLATLAVALPTTELAVEVALPVIETSLDIASIANQANTLSCGSRPGSGKRGVAYNEPMYTRFFKAPNSKVSWMYNWFSTTPTSTTPDTGYTYVPLLHGLRGEHTSVWFQNVKTQYEVFCSYNAMSFNEPDNWNIGEGSGIGVGDAIAGYRQWMQPLASYRQIRLGSPAITNGDKDPQGRPMGINWLKPFLEGCVGCKIDFIAMHWYAEASNFEYFKSHVQNVYALGGGRPIWITEFGPLGNDGQRIEFLKKALPWLDSLDWVERYAMHMATNSGQFALIKPDGTGLNAVGEVYNTY